MWVNIKLYNTACSLDAQGLGKEFYTIFKHLENQTVGEYFVNIIIPNIVKYLNTCLNIKDLNEKYLRLAREGLKKISKKNKFACFDCKSNSAGNFMICKYCKRMTYETCA